VLTIAEVHKSFGRQRVLDGVTIDLARGETCLLRGGNGAGKSTLCEVVAGVLDADAGTVTVDGRSIREGSARAAIGYAPAHASLPEHLFVHEWLDLLAALRGATAPEVDAATARWGLSTCTDSRLAALSLGQRRRLALAAAELAKPTWLLLDEPTVGLDAEGRALLVQWVRAHVENGGGALVASHEESLAHELDARIVSLERGRTRWEIPSNSAR